MVNVNPTIIHGILNFYVCLFSHKIGAFPGIGSRRSVSVEGQGAMFLEGCRSPSCFAAEKQDVLHQFSVGRHAIFNIIGQSFHYRSLADLIQAMPVKGVGGHEIRGVPFT